MGHPAPSAKRESELVNHGRCCGRIDVWVESSRLERLPASLWSEDIVQQTRKSANQDRSAMERSSTKLRLASFLRSIMAVGEPVKGQDERHQTAPLTASPTRQGTCVLDKADDFIDISHPGIPSGKGFLNINPAFL
jgi:hypothetical protein